MFVVWIPRQSRRREPYGGLDHPSTQVLHRSRSFHAAHLDGGSHVALLRHMDASPLLPVSGRPAGAAYIFFTCIAKIHFKCTIVMNSLRPKL